MSSEQRRQPGRTRCFFSRVSALSMSSATACLMVALPGVIAAQQPSMLPRAEHWSIEGLPLLAGVDEDLARTAQLEGANTAGFLLRSTSSLAAALEPAATWRVSLLAPAVTTRWNSDIPFSQNEAFGWSGRGWNTVATGGLRLTGGPLTITIAPQFTFSENQDFEIVESVVPGRTHFSMPWFTDTLSIDLPVRFGEDRIASVEPGQSSIQLALGPITVGGGTESHWWGPGARNAIVLSNNAPGFVHGALRSSRPVDVGIGRVEWVWLAGRLESSEYFRDFEARGDRSLSAFAVTLQPGFDPGLTLGFARSVYAPLDGGIADALAEAPAAILDWSGANELDQQGDGPSSEQLFSAFGRWVFPAVGGEVYAEWARYRLPLSFRDLLTQPNHSQGYTVGMQLLRPVFRSSDLRLQAEATNLERSATYRLRPTGSYYSSLSIPEGYTHRGKVLGAAIGPGSSSQWLAADMLMSSGRIGLFGSRIRWHNDAYFRRLAPWLFFGHDVSLLAGVRGGLDWAGFRWDAELSLSKRHNFLFQNQGISWETADRAVDVVNRSLRVTLSPIVVGTRR